MQFGKLNYLYINKQVQNKNPLTLTSSENSGLREEWTPAMNGVGVLSTSMSPAGSSGMYT